MRGAETRGSASGGTQGQTGRVPGFEVLLIDGRSGAGKTQLADRLLAELRAAGQRPEVLRVEHLYPGWDGLAAGSSALAAALDTGEYRPYDWVAERFGAAQRIGPGRPLVIEGCGAVTRENLAAAARFAGPGGRVRSRWVECPAAARRERALARDGEMYAPHWERWAAQEEAHYARHRPWELVDEVVAGGAA